MLLDFSCGTGTREMNPGLIKDVNGRRIGRMYGWCPSTWVYHVEWYVCIGRTLPYAHGRPPKVDLTKEYWNNVFQPSLKTWETGWTPNPDVWCNK